MVKKSQIIRRWKKKYLGKWDYGNAIPYSLALLEILEKIVTTHIYMCFFSLLSVTIIYTEALLHCKWRNLEPRGKKKRIERERRQTKQLREWESWDARERERESHLCPILWWAKCLQPCAGAANQKNLQSFCCCCASKPLGWKIRLFFPFIL